MSGFGSGFAPALAPPSARVSAVPASAPALPPAAARVPVVVPAHCSTTRPRPRSVVGSSIARRGTARGRARYVAGGERQRFQLFLLVLWLRQDHYCLRTVSRPTRLISSALMPSSTSSTASYFAFLSPATRTARSGFFVFSAFRVAGQPGAVDAAVVALGVLDRDRTVGAHHDARRVARHLRALAGAGQVDRTGRHHRRCHHEDDEQHQHDVDVRHDVDFVFRRRGRMAYLIWRCRMFENSS